MMTQTCPGSVISTYRVRSQRGLIALLVGLALSLGMIIETQAATTWTVCASGCNYSRIKAAIAAPTTVDGDTLAIAAGTYTEPGITVTKSLTLQGEDAATTLVQAAATPGAAPDRVLTIASGLTVTMRELTLRHGVRPGYEYPGGGGLLNQGTLTLINSIIRGNSSYYGGGLSNIGTLTLTQSTISGNASPWGDGGGLYNAGTLTLIQSTISGNTTTYGSGGGLANDGTLTLTSSTVSGNAAANNGGGGLANSGTVTLTQSTVSGNVAGFDGGGGLFNYYGTLTLINSTVSGNTSTYGCGGGIRNWSGTITLTQSTISGNANPGGCGGGLHNDNQSTLTLTNSTVSANAAYHGGGLFNSGTLTLTSSTISGNVVNFEGGGLKNFGTAMLINSIIANHADGGDCRNFEGGSIISEGYTLDSDGSCHLTSPTDLPGTDPRLGPLQDNGGPTLTHALLPGSPALDAIPWGTNGCGTTLISDQRWQARPEAAEGACDIGAYEVTVAGQPLSAWVTGLTPQTVVCKNVTTEREVTLSHPAAAWNCEAAGLQVAAGDRVALLVRGRVQQGATDVGGAVDGMAPTSGGCANLTTGRQVAFQHMVGATAASCVAAGLVIHPGDQVQLHVQGAAE